MTPWVLAVAILLPAATAQAQVYRCGPPGAAVFSDRPCADGGTQLKALSASPTGAVEFEVPVFHYEVHARELRGAVHAIRTQNPGGFWGWAGWQVHYKYEHTETGGSCAVKHVTVRVQGKITMPRWVNEAEATQAEQTEWRRMYADLKRHEDGHIQHGREFALLLKERLLGMAAGPCGELAARASGERQRLLANLQQRDAEYDRRTDHGLRQDNPR